jgi:hypothetical protein
MFRRGGFRNLRRGGRSSGEVIGKGDERVKEKTGNHIVNTTVGNWKLRSEVRFQFEERPEAADRREAMPEAAHPAR